MKKTIRLTESQLTNLIKKVVRRTLNEQVQSAPPAKKSGLSTLQPIEDASLNLSISSKDGYRGFRYMTMMGSNGKYYIAVAAQDSPNDFVFGDRVHNAFGAGGIRPEDVNPKVYAVLNGGYQTKELADDAMIKLVQDDIAQKGKLLPGNAAAGALAKAKYGADGYENY